MPDALPAAARRSAFAGLALAAALALVVATAPAAAAATHTYGEMVDYPLVFPVVGDVTYADWFYAQRYNGDHHAQDLMGTKMLPIVAAASGRIEYVNWSSNPDDLRPEKCCSLALRHDDGWQTYYIHLNNDSPGTDDGQGWGIAPGIRPGVHVQAGELIGWMGDSGNAEGTSPHLHFELRDPAGVIVNPYAGAARRRGQGQPGHLLGRAAAPLSTPLLDGTRLLRKGISGADVGELQGFLNLRGHEAGPVDRVFGSMTDLAVRAFQRERGLNADGVVGAADPGRGPRDRPGQRVRLAHRPQRPRPAPRGGPRRGRAHPAGVAAGARLRRRALRRGLRHQRTAQAVSAFQTAAGLPADGKVGPSTRAALANGPRHHRRPLLRVAARCPAASPGGEPGSPPPSTRARPSAAHRRPRHGTEAPAPGPSGRSLSYLRIGKRCTRRVRLHRAPRPQVLPAAVSASTTSTRA